MGLVTFRIDSVACPALSRFCDCVVPPFSIKFTIAFGVPENVTSNELPLQIDDGAEMLAVGVETTLIVID